MSLLITVMKLIEERGRATQMGNTDKVEMRLVVAGGYFGNAVMRLYVFTLCLGGAPPQHRSGCGSCRSHQVAPAL